MCDQLELYAVHSLLPGEREAFELHLATCATCSATLPSYYDALAQLALELDPVKPPARMKMRVLSMTSRGSQEVPAPLAPVVPMRRKSSRRVGVWMMSAAAAVALFALGGVWGTAQTGDQPQGNRGVAVQRMQAAEAVWDEVMAAPDSTSIQKASANGGRVQVVYSNQLGRAVVASDKLPKLSTTQVYQVWFQRNGVMEPVGTVSQNGDFMLAPEESLAGVSAVGLTVEPTPGSDSPTTAPLVFLTL